MPESNSPTKYHDLGCHLDKFEQSSSNLGVGKHHEGYWGLGRTCGGAGMCGLWWRRLLAANHGTHSHANSRTDSDTHPDTYTYATAADHWAHPVGKHRDFHQSIRLEGHAGWSLPGYSEE